MPVPSEPSQYAPAQELFRYASSGVGCVPTVGSPAGVLVSPSPTPTLRLSYGQPPELEKHGASSPIGSYP